MKKTLFFILAIWASTRLCIGQGFISLQASPVHISGIQPLSVGIGFGKKFNDKIQIDATVLFTYMDQMGSGDGGYEGYRIILDFRRIINTTKNISLTIFPTYWNTTAPRGDEPGEYTFSPTTRIKWGLGIGFIKAWKIAKKINVEFAIGPEFNQVIYLGKQKSEVTLQHEDIKRISYEPRLRAGLKFAFQL